MPNRHSSGDALRPALRPLRGSALRASHEAANASSPKDSIPNAAQELRNNADALTKWMESVSEQQREAIYGFSGRGYPLEQRVADALDIGFRLASSVIHLAKTVASAIETQSAKTEGLGPQDESAVAKPDAQGGQHDT
jgi:hypothetical protein